MKKMASPLVGKVLFIGVIVILLIIANVFIKSKLDTRESTRDSAVSRISNGAGGAFAIREVKLVVPYIHYIKKTNSNGKSYVDSTYGESEIRARVLNYNAKINAQEKNVGIYKAPIFTGEIAIDGEFDCNLRNNADYTYAFKNAKMIIYLNDKSILEVPTFTINGVDKATDFFNGYEENDMDNKYRYVSKVYSGVGTAFTCKEGTNTFSTVLKIRGAEKFSVKLSSKQTRMNVESDWKSPGFTDYAYLPVTHNITDTGFTADWFVPFDAANGEHDVGFTLFQPVDVYKMLDRAINYGFLFIIVPFLVLFLFEIFMNVSLHPMHYLLCGAASIVFFLLLMSFSEHIPFLLAYLISALASGVVTSLYVGSITGKIKSGFQMCGVFIIMYGYLFFSLKSEDYALLIGSIFTFIVIAMLMYFTRKLDWASIKNTNLKSTKETE